MKKLQINEKSIKTELAQYKDKPYKCLFEYIWNSFDAKASIINLTFDLPEHGIGYVKNVKISDNGKGWDFSNTDTTDHFISSTKESFKNKTLPRGKYGRGRYVFIWLSKYIEVFSGNKKLILEHSTNIKKEDVENDIKGTIVKFHSINEAFSNALSSKELKKALILEFGWFIAQNKNYQIIINGIPLNLEDYIKEEEILNKDDFSQDIQNGIKDDFEVKIILWNEKPMEFSKFYFLNKNKEELLKDNTGLNKKNDNFYHSVYIYSSLYSINDDFNETENEVPKLEFENKENKKIKQQLIREIKEKLVFLRKPYLQKESQIFIESLQEDKIMPNLDDFGIYDTESYNDLIKTVYTIAPSIFVNKSKDEKRFMCATFAGLLSNQDDTLVKKILEQLLELSEAEKKDLLDILNRTSLSSVLKTIKEIDHRLEVLEKLKILISEYEKETLEVKHIQKILDENFWIFGEQFRLFSSTEGALKNVLIKYAKDILEIEDPELETQPNGEVDLFLTKTENSNGVQTNVVVELKRASIKLRKKEYDQIEGYMEKILEQSLCNDETQHWEFYLIGKNFDDHIKRKIDSAKNHGEKSRGLTLSINDGRVKVYVRKWSGILESEWGTKMKYLKEKLEIKAKGTGNNPEDITNNLIKNT